MLLLMYGTCSNSNLMFLLLRLIQGILVELTVQKNACGMPLILTKIWKKEWEQNQFLRKIKWTNALSGIFHYASRIQKVQKCCSNCFFSKLTELWPFLYFQCSRLYGILGHPIFIPAHPFDGWTIMHHVLRTQHTLACSAWGWMNEWIHNVRLVYRAAVPASEFGRKAIEKCNFC